MAKTGYSRLRAPGAPNKNDKNGTRMKLTKKCRSAPARLCASVLVAGTLFLSALSYQAVAQVDTSSGMPSNQEIFGFVQDIIDFGPRRTGSEANVRTADYIANKFRDFGLQDVAIETGDTWQWDARKWSLEAGGVGIPAFYMRHSFHPGKAGPFSTGPDGLNAEFVYVGDHQDLDGIDVKGKIVVADVALGDMSMWKIKLAAEKF